MIVNNPSPAGSSTAASSLERPSPAACHPLSAKLLLITVVLIGILTLPAVPYGGDPVEWRMEARSILIYGELNVPSSFATAYGEPGQFFVLNHRNGKYYAKAGTLNGILNVVPLLVGAISLTFSRCC